MPRLRPWWIALPLALLPPLLGTCRPGRDRASEPRVEAATALRGWHYQVRIDPSLEHADVRLCFDGRPPPQLVPASRSAAPHARALVRADGEPLPRRGRGASLASLGDDACVRYTVDFVGLEQDEDTRRTVGRVGRSLITRPVAWLWRPDPMPEEAEVTVRFSLPEGT